MSDDRRWVAAARPQMGAVGLMAGRVHPATAAAVITDVLDDDAFADLVEDIEDESNGGVLVRLPQYFPALANTPVQWIKEVISGILASIIPDGGDGDDKRDTSGVGVDDERESGSTTDAGGP